MLLLLKIINISVLGEEDSYFNFHSWLGLRLRSKFNRALPVY
jgi:hypothetical protein